MIPIVVDSSVAIKWFLPGPLSDKALRFLEGNHELLAPDLIIPECGNVLWKKISRNDLRPDEGREILQALGRTPLNIVGSQDLVEAALEIATSFRRTVYDGLYVALAVARDCVLVTADDHLARALAGGPLGANVRSLGDME